MSEPRCPIKGCGADPKLGNGSPEMLCRGYGLSDARCMANWASSDPEDRESYAEYLRDWVVEERPGVFVLRTPLG